MDIKATIKKSGLSQAAFGRIIDRDRLTVWRWLTDGEYNRKPSKLMQMHIRNACKEHNIEIVEESVDSTM